MTRLTESDVKRIVDERLEEHLGEQNSGSSKHGTIEYEGPEEWPFEVMDGHDIGRAAEEQLAPAEYSIHKYGVDPEDHESLESFRSAVRSVKEGES